MTKTIMIFITLQDLEDFTATITVIISMTLGIVICITILTIHFIGEQAFT